jgi:hypothetical protein
MANKMIGIDGKPLPPPQKGPIPFKKWLYHKAFPARIVHSKSEVEALMADGWETRPVERQRKDAGGQTTAQNAPPAEITEEMRKEIAAEAYEKVRAETRAEIYEKVYDEVKAEIRVELKKAYEKVKTEIRAEIYDEVGEEVKEPTDEDLTKAQLVEKYALEMDPKEHKKDEILEAVKEKKAKTWPGPGEGNDDPA